MHLERFVFFNLGIIVIIVVGLVAAEVITDGTESLFVVWVASLIAAVVLFFAISWVNDHNVPRLLIDERNKTSLSRLQMTAWTLLIFSALGVALPSNTRADISVSVVGDAISNPKSFELGAGSTIEDALREAGILPLPDNSNSNNDEGDGGKPDTSELPLTQTLHNGDQIIVPLQESSQPEELIISAEDKQSITIPSELWLLVGISTTSLVGSPFLRTLRDTQNEGKKPIVTNSHFNQAKWSDLFLGEEDSNDKKPDLAKIQMFYLTVVLVITYGIMLGVMFDDAGSKDFIDIFPELSPGIITLLGISHAGYLVNKVTPKTGRGITIIEPGDEEGKEKVKKDETTGLFIYPFKSSFPHKEGTEYHWSYVQGNKSEGRDGSELGKPIFEPRLSNGDVVIKLAIFTNDEEGTVYTSRASFKVQNESVTRTDID